MVFGQFSSVATVWQKRSRLGFSEARSRGNSATRGRRRGTGAILSACGGLIATHGAGAGHRWGSNNREPSKCAVS